MLSNHLYTHSTSVLRVLQASHQMLAQGRTLLEVRDKDDIIRIRANILVSVQSS